VGASGRARAVVVAVAAIAAALALTVPGAQAFLLDMASSPFTHRYPEQSTFAVEHRFTVSGYGASSYAVDVPLASDMSDCGQEVSVTFTGQPSELDRYGMSWGAWNGSLTAGESAAFSVIYEVALTTSLPDVSSPLGVDAVPQYLRDAYLHDEWKIEMSDPAVASKAREVAGSGDAASQLESLYDWIVKSIKYRSLSGEPQTASRTLSDGMGDCDDQAILLISMARSLGIPAWLQLGAIYSKEDGTWGAHGWARAYVPTASGGVNVTIDTVSRDLMVHTPNRITEYSDDGVAEHMVDAYYLFSSVFKNGASPRLAEEYVAISYAESAKKVSLRPVFSIDGLVAVARHLDDGALPQKLIQNALGGVGGQARPGG